MKLELSIAADKALVVRPPHPMSRAFPASSSLVTPSTPLRETGSCAPTRAHATPSSNRCFARAHGRGDVVKRGFGEPGGKPSCGPIRVGGGLGAFARYFGLNGLASDSHEEPFIKYRSIKRGQVFRKRIRRRALE